MPAFFPEMFHYHALHGTDGEAESDLLKDTFILNFLRKR
jgi:hypothetical protein